MFGLNFKMPWTRRRERLLAEARAKREAISKKKEEDRQRRMEAARKDHERYTALLVARERDRADRAEREARQLREAQESARKHDLFGSPTPAIEFPRWHYPEPETGREWNSTAPAVFGGSGGSFDGGGASGNWSSSDSGGSSSSDSGSSGGGD